MLFSNSSLVCITSLHFPENDSLGEALEERKDPNVPTGLIERMMEVVLDCNLFEFIEDIFMVKRVDKKIIISIYFWTHHAE